MIFSARRPILLNGIEDLASRGDLLDRMIIVRLPAIKQTGRRPEREFWEEFERVSGRILGALFDVGSAVMRNLSNMDLAEPPRMADFSKIGCAAELALGFKEGEFIEAYGRNRAEASLTALEASPAAVEIPRLLPSTPKGTWEGSAGDLLADLNRMAGDQARRDRFWPRSARAMAAVLDRAKLSLEHVGIRTERLPRDGGTGKGGLRFSPSHRHAAPPGSRGLFLRGTSDPRLPQQLRLLNTRFFLAVLEQTALTN